MDETKHAQAINQKSCKKNIPATREKDNTGKDSSDKDNTQKNNPRK